MHLVFEFCVAEGMHRAKPEQGKTISYCTEHQYKHKTKGDAVSTIYRIGSGFF